MDHGTQIAPLTAVPADSTALVTFCDGDGDEVEFVLVRVADDDVRAWRNRCRHWTDVHLDGGDGATLRGGDIVCRRHGATFACETGRCDFGPCEGAVLPGADVAVRDGVVYLVDDDYEFVRVGPAATDRDRDRSTNPGERLGF